ncbi:hypothetical protein BayCH28_05630 [Mycolicibacterium sp. CH28]|uniref:hypothetical protein n=1 Tax=Mycolicibacterium sp. CH28 TaxID=2512237 RepID=UPI0010812EB4|nr:hypothetical protein [Mycolicibacterium sp. CH28]TGD88879.1 hypothetical protein BayCH28_05630 [Mycolicibacterium sp. CH28]
MAAMRTGLMPNSSPPLTVPIRPAAAVGRPIVAAVILTAGLLSNIPVAQAASCSSSGPPADVNARPFNGGTLWVSRTGTVGISTADGTGSVQVPSASPIGLQALVVDARDDGRQQLIVSNGRVAHLYVLAGCQITAAVDPQGQPFLFDLENLRGNGTGIGCSDLGDGRHLVGLQALPDGAGYAVRRTEIDLDGATATIGRSDTVTGTSQQDPAVASALTISCGEQTMTQDGVQQP